VTVIAPEGLDSLVSTAQAAFLAGVTDATIRKWRERAKLTPAGIDDQGHPLYRLIDIARVERATREKARRTWQ
jgi:DNA-binding transcriptional MerR regulator